MSDTAIVEIAGRDSIAAALQAVRLRSFSELIPTVAYVGTEIGDREAPLHAIDVLQQSLGAECHVLEPVVLSDPPLWSALNTRFAAGVRSLLGLWSPCLACHLYLHLLRVPISWQAGNTPIIAGERDSHDGRVKLSQLPQGIDATGRVLAHAGIELMQPLRSWTGAEVAALVGNRWQEGHGQLGCLLSGNYTQLDGSVLYDETAYAAYALHFLEPVGRAVVDAWRKNHEDNDSDQPDYVAIVRAVLESTVTTELRA